MKDPSPELTRFAERIAATCAWQSTSKHRWVESFSLVRDGVVIEGAPNRGSKGSLLGTTLRVRGGAALTWLAVPITLRRETSLDRMGKALGINREVCVGDPGFDKEVYIESDEADEVIFELLEDAEVKEACRLIASTNTNVIVASGGVTLFIPSGVFGHAAIDAAVDRFVRLHTLVSRIRTGVDPYGRLPPRSLPPRKPDHLSRKLSVTAVIVALFVVWVFVDGSPTFGGAHRVGLEVGAALWLVALAICVGLFRGRSSGFRAVLGFGALFGLLVPVGPIALREANALAMDGPTTLRPAEAREIHPSKGAPYVAVRLLSDPETEVTTGFDRVIAAGNSRLGSAWVPATVTTREGRFGWPWLVKVEALPPQIRP